MSFHKDLRTHKNCTDKKSSNNPNGLNREELLQICRDLKLSCNSKTTKDTMCTKIIEYFDAQDHLTQQIPQQIPQPIPQPIINKIRIKSKEKPIQQEKIKIKSKQIPQIEQIPQVIKKIQPYTETYTLTFGDQAENHKGMQKLGKEAKIGFNIEDLQKAEHWFKNKGCHTELINLNTCLDGIEATQAAILVIRNGVEALTGSSADDLYQEQKKLAKDTQAFMYGHVVNKHARHNLCFADISQPPNYQNKQGTIIAFKDVQLLNHIRNILPDTIGQKAEQLVAEGNYYYNPEICGIGWHGDSERKLVIALRLGLSMPMHFQWYHKFLPVGKRYDLILNHGDIYYMSEKAVGWDWKKSSIYTLRHAAGAKKFTDYKQKNKK